MLTHTSEEILINYFVSRKQWLPGTIESARLPHSTNSSSCNSSDGRLSVRR